MKGQGLPDPFVRELEGRYRIGRKLGEGGSAAVYLATDLKLDRPVALKVLHTELTVAVGASRFVREIRTTAGLRHPHILPLFDSGEAAGLPFYVMPFVEGETLRTRLDRVGALSLDEALALFQDVASPGDDASRRCSDSPNGSPPRGAGGGLCDGGADGLL